MTEPTDKTSFVSNEPVIVGHFVLWLFVNLGAFVVGHTHLVTSSQWGSLTTGLVPVVTALLLGVLATVMRKYVSPAWKKFQSVGSHAGFPTLTDEQLNSLTEKIYESLIAKNPSGLTSNSTVPPIAVDDSPLPEVASTGEPLPPFPVDMSLAAPQ